ncbi:ANGPT1 [Branchiostoma lanceolatum]|uniref:ANGPT1 protein n=1 Tax=Branchiostoma lanceolatum TaxID=7740 RepID=A0A8J9VM50_BRALA|nr:ANGPT1 [Branchiostoma lanceolatum]
MAAFTLLQTMLLVRLISTSGQRNSDVQLKGEVTEDGKCVYSVLMQHQRGEITCQPSWKQLLSRAKRDPGVQGQEGSHSRDVQDDPPNRKQTLEAEKLLVLLRNLTDCDSTTGDCSVDPLIQLQRLELKARELEHENYVCRMNKTFAEWELELKNKDLKVQTNELRGLLSSRENVIRELQNRMNILRQKLQAQGIAEIGDTLEQKGFGTDASEYQAITDILPQLQAQEHMLREYETAVNSVIQRTNEQAKVIEKFQYDLRSMDFRVKALARNMTIAMQQEQQGDFRNSEKYFQLQRDLKGELEKYYGKYRDRILSVQERLGKQERLVNQYYNGILEQVQSNQRQDDAVFKMKVQLKEIKDKLNISTIEWQNRFNQLISRADLTMVYPQFQPNANVVEGGNNIPEQYLTRLIDLEDTVSIQSSFLNDNTKVVSEMRRSMDYLLLRFENVTRAFNLLRRRPPVTITTTTDGSAVDRSMVALLEEYEKRLGELEPRIVQYETKLGYQEEKIRRLEQENQMIRPYLERMSTLEQRMMFLEDATGNGRAVSQDVKQPNREVTHEFNANIVSPEGSTPYDYDNRVVYEENQPEVRTEDTVPREYDPRYPDTNIVVPVEGIYVPVPGQPGSGQQTAPPQYTTEPQVPPQYPEIPPQYPGPEVPPQYPEPEIPPQYPEPEVPPQYPEPEVPPQYPEPEVPPQYPEPEVPPQYPEPEIPPKYTEPEVPPPEIPEPEREPPQPEYPEPVRQPDFPTPQEKPDDVSTDVQGGIDEPVVPVVETGGADLCGGKPRDCAALYQQGEGNSGIHTICPEGSSPFEVWCDMAGQDGPGWTVIQRRLDGSISFDRPWAEYRKGLGDLDTEYWLGNDNLHFLTSQQKYVLRITAAAWDGDLRYVDYREFAIANESKEYQVTYDRRISNTEGDFIMNGAKFSTWDKDQDTHAYENCASRLGGGGWYTNCGVTANVNGRYYTGGSYLSQTGFPDGLFWAAWEGPWYSMRLTVMKLRPVDFSDE